MRHLTLCLSTSLMLVACDPGVYDPTVTITARSGGQEIVQEASYAEIVAPALRELPELRADGHATTDPAVLWTGSRFELPRASSDGSVATTPGRLTVTRDELVLVGDRVVVTRSADFSALVVKTGVETIEVDVDGIEDQATRARLLGHLAAGFLGAETAPTVTTAGFGATATLVALGIGYATCVAGGTSLCGNTAYRLCGKTTQEFAVICGAGWDVDKKFQLGFKCSFRCK